MNRLLLIFTCLFLSVPFAATAAEVGREKPNVILIAIDDLNDWIGCLGGHPQVKTPNIDRLAARGVLFNNAHCQSPVCNPSRASMMSGLYPETTGIYFLNPSIEEAPVIDRNTLMPKRFQDEGYYVTAAGKLFHGRENKKYLPNYGSNFGGFGPFPKKKISPFPGHKLWDWGAFPERDEQTPDYKIASWAVDQLKKTHEQPLWLGVGFYRPHVPQYAPQKWLDMYPLETVQLPKFKDDDLSDLSEYAVNITRLKHISPTHEWVTDKDEWKNLVRTYLACISFVDHQVGRVLDAIDSSAYSKNTYIVLYTDHGFHQGEKERYAKRSIWQDGAGVPMMISGPGIAKGKVCNKPVQLLDIYPTLLDLTNLKANPKHEGNSLKPLLENPNANWSHVARCSFGPGNVAIISESHRYIHYNDGTEELYDRKADLHEWNNIATNPEMKAILKMHRARLPKTYHTVLGAGSTGHNSFEATEKLLKP